MVLGSRSDSPPPDPADLTAVLAATRNTKTLGDPPLDVLGPFERWSFRFIDALWRRHRRLTEAYNKTVGMGYIIVGSGRMLHVRGLERLAHLSADDGILLVSNHRSFFDLYELITTLYRRSHLRQPALCPVRGNFFYERPLGVAVNLLAGGGRMYPPFFREPGKLEFNKWALARTAEVLREGRVVVGFHPEGTRNKNADPYTPLPAQPGVGKLVMDCWPIVVPAFIQGMGQNILSDIRANFTGERFAVAVFGEPIDLRAFHPLGNRLTSHKRVADHLLKKIYELGDEEKRARVEIEALRRRA